MSLFRSSGSVWYSVTTHGSLIAFIPLRLPLQAAQIIFAVLMSHDSYQGWPAYMICRYFTTCSYISVSHNFETNYNLQSFQVKKFRGERTPELFFLSTDSMIYKFNHRQLSSTISSSSSFTFYGFCRFFPAPLCICTCNLVVVFQYFYFQGGCQTYLRNRQLTILCKFWVHFFCIFVNVIL